jgi:hypothetical protein
MLTPKRRSQVSVHSLIAEMYFLQVKNQFNDLRFSNASGTY